MNSSYDPILEEKYGIAGRVGRGAATIALRGVMIALLGATLVTARAVEPLRGGNVRQRVRRALWPDFAE